MSKKITALLLATIMIFSMLLFSSCDDKNTREKNTSDESDESEAAIVLTPKEKFLTMADATATYFSEMKSAMGYTAASYTISDDKMEMATLGVELNKLAMGGADVLEEPIKLTAQATVDSKNDSTKMLMELGIGDSTLPIEMITTTVASYLNIENVTDKILKMPMEGEMPEFDNEQLSQLLDVYYDIFMDSFSADLFTETTGEVTVDGVAISNAKTIRAKITSKQLLTAMKAVLEKAKTDVQVESVVNFFSALSQDPTLEDFDTIISEAITSLETSIADASDTDYLTFEIVFEENTLRSAVVEVFEEDAKIVSISFTTVKKDNNYYVKGSLVDEKTDESMTFAYEQIANSNGSADGKFEMSVPETMELSVEFKGTKTENKLVLDTDIELTITQDDVETTVPLKAVITCEKISDTENSTTIDLSMDALQTEFEITISSNVKLVDYAAIEAPSDNDVEVVDEDYDYQALIMQIMTEYPEIGTYLSGLMGTGLPTESEGIMLYSEDYTETINLQDDGRGSIVMSYDNITYSNGTYSADLSGQTTTGTYSVNGDILTINGKAGYIIEEEEYYTTIKSPDDSVYIYVTGESTAEMEYFFSYTLENDVLTIDFDYGESVTLSCVNNGETYTIEGEEYYVDQLY